MQWSCSTNGWERIRYKPSMLAGPCIAKRAGASYGSVCPQVAQVYASSDSAVHVAGRGAAGAGVDSSAWALPRLSLLLHPDGLGALPRLSLLHPEGGSGEA